MTAITILGIALSMYVAILAFLIAYDNPNSSTGWVQHTQLVYRQIQATFNVALDGETGKRGYIITGRDSYLEPYQGAKERLDYHLKTLRELTRDNPAQQKNVLELQRTLEGAFKEMQLAINARREKGIDAAAEVIGSDRGKKLMDKAREIIRRMEDIEDSYLTTRTHRSHSEYYKIIIALIVLILRDVIWCSMQLECHKLKTKGLENECEHG